MPRTFGDNLRRIRRARHVTQSRLAGLLHHRSTSAISSWETGDGIPRPDTIARIASALWCNTWELLEGVTTPYDILKSEGTPALPAFPREHPIASGSPSPAASADTRASSLVIGTFACDPALHVSTIHGDVAHYLECETSDLEVHGWKPYIHNDSTTAIDFMLQDLGAVRAGRYALRACSKSGERVDLGIRTFLVHGHDSSSVRGAIDLLAWSSPRTYIDLHAGGRSYRKYDA